jgi:hypothetical protein
VFLGQRLLGSMFTSGWHVISPSLWKNLSLSEEKLAHAIAELLSSGPGALPTPSAIARFVHANSWHYSWDWSIARDWRRRKLARALWKPGADHMRLLKHAGEAVPSSHPAENLRRLVSAAAGGGIPYLECGHRALAAAAIAEAVGIPVRYVTLYSNFSKTTVLTHHLLELEGDYGWEMHDPDYGFYFTASRDRIASVETALNQPVRVAEYIWRPRVRMARHVAMLVRGGFFQAVSTRLYDKDDTLFISNDDLTHAVFEHDGRALSFPEYWRIALSQSATKEVIFTGRSISIRGAKMPAGPGWKRKSPRRQTVRAGARR